MFPGSHTSKYKTRCMQGDDSEAVAEAGAKAWMGDRLSVPRRSPIQALTQLNLA